MSIELDNLRTKLVAAQNARHLLMIGKMPERISYAGRETQFTKAELPQLNAYIADLTAAVAKLEGVATPRSKPILLGF